MMQILLRAYASHRYAILFYTLLATLAAVPLLVAMGYDAELLEIFLALSLLAGALGFESGLRKRMFLVLTVTVLAAHFVLPQRYLGGMPAMPALWTVIALLSAASALRFAMRSTRIDAEHIYAALSAYLLAGVFFGVLYHGVEQVWPGSFNVAGAKGEFPLFDAIYFSFVTLATLGYGDLLPVSEVARGLAIVEAVSGQLFLAVMIARLVGSYAQMPRK